LFTPRAWCVAARSARRGSAGNTTTAAEISTEPHEQWFFNQFRLGLWPEIYEGGQYSSDPSALDPTGKGRARWATRWKPALNAFAITFDGRIN